MSLGHYTIPSVMTYVGVRFFVCRIGNSSIVHLRFSLLPCFIMKSCARRIMDFFLLGGRFPTGDG